MGFASEIITLLSAQKKEKQKHKLHKIQGEDDDDDDSEDEDYCKDNELFDDNLQFHFSNQGPAYDDGDDFQDHYYQEEDDYEEDQDNGGNGTEDGGAERAMSVKALGVDTKLGKDTSMGSCGVPKSGKRDNGLRTKTHIKRANFGESGVPKPIYTDNGLRPTKYYDSKPLEIKLDKSVSKSNLYSGQVVAANSVGNSVNERKLILDCEREL